MTDKRNREAWLSKAVDMLTPRFKQHGYEIPEVRVSCGFPSRSGLANRNRRIGECWSADAADDKRSQIFISPTLSDYNRVLGVLTHELVHASVGLQHKHNKEFKRCATAIGLVGKMTSTTESPELVAHFASLKPALGDYPHSGLVSMSRTKQSTRLLKCQCGECGYTIRTTAKWIEVSGPPICPCNNSLMEKA